MTQIIAVSKLTRNVLTATDPNHFLFHSSYNTFKIILEGTKSVSLTASTSDQSFTQAHSLSFIPLVTGFAKQSTVSQVFLPNSRDVYLWGPKLGWTGDVIFNYIKSDSTNITFNFSNNGSAVTVNIRYYCLESII